MGCIAQEAGEVPFYSATLLGQGRRIALSVLSSPGGAAPCPARRDIAAGFGGLAMLRRRKQPATGVSRDKTERLFTAPTSAPAAFCQCSTLTNMSANTCVKTGRFFLATKITEYGQWTRWGVSHQGLAEYLFLHMTVTIHPRTPAPGRVHAPLGGMGGVCVYRGCH